MSSLTIEDFPSFFAAVRGGATPFPWQYKLVKSLVNERKWPDRIIVPTSGGKTAVIDAHVFAVALMADQLDTNDRVQPNQSDHLKKRIPRRLVLVVPRRALVDSQFEHACHIAQMLKDAQFEPDSVLGRVANALTNLRWSNAPLEGPVPGSPLVVARLRGGLPVPRAWRDDPVACAVISATPEMWGSRLLFRGYGSSPRSWAREAGLLGMDAVVIVDEAHLARQLLVTARSVAALEQGREGKHFRSVPTLQVVETTATPLSDQDSMTTTDTDESEAEQSTNQMRTLTISDADLHPDALGTRLSRSKNLSLHVSPNWLAQKKQGEQTGTVNDQQIAVQPTTPATKKTGRTRKPKKDERLALVEEIVEETCRLHATYGQTVGVFVNTVSLAVEVASKLRETTPLGKQIPFEVALVCGRLRDYDLIQLQKDYPNLLTIEGNKKVDVLVATQSLEVGVDLDLAAAVSELAPAQSLVQRAGRVNRLGKRENTEFVVVVPERDKLDKMNVSFIGPYFLDDLKRAYDWLEKRMDSGGDLSPLVLSRTPLPLASARRPFFQRVELADSWWWARTSDKVVSSIDLDLWLLDELNGFGASFAEAGVVVRKAMPHDVMDAIELIKAIPPKEYEAFSAPIFEVRKLRDKLVEQASRGEAPAAVIVRGKDVLDAAATKVLRPEDILVIDDRTECFTEHVLDVERLESSKQTESKNGGGCEPDVSEVRIDPRSSEIVLRVDPESWADEAGARFVLAQYENILSEVTSESSRRKKLADILQQYNEYAKQQLKEDSNQQCNEHSNLVDNDVIKFLRKGRVKQSNIVLSWTDGENSSLRRLVVVDQRKAVSDDEIRQVWTPSDEPPSLAKHSQDVAERAKKIGERLGLDPWLVTVLELGGRHHDDGKAEPGFQEKLGWTGGELLAKSYRTSTSTKAPSSLPDGWRHEQLSVVKSYSSLQERFAENNNARDLALRLVGTSHGHGRVSFPHGTSELLSEHSTEDERKIAHYLYDIGHWDDLIERTHRRYGVWGCAFLEAVLRAADGQVSGEAS